MTKKIPDKEISDQYRRFLEKVQELVDAGELNPTEAEERFEQAMDRVATRESPSPEHE